MDEIILVGGGGHCHSVIDVIEQEKRFQIAGIVDQQDKLGSQVLGYDVMACDEEIAVLSKKYTYALITVGQLKSAGLRMKLYRMVQIAGFQLPTVISPRAYVSRHARVGQGSIIMHDALVNAGAVVGENCIINSKALIEHDCEIENHCHISTSATLNGGVYVGAASFVGSHATTREGAVITANAFIKAGSVVK